MITNLHLPDKGLFYALDINFLDKFREIEQFRPKNEFRVPPEYGDGFLYLDKDRCYRGYRLKSNPANKIALRAFLIDIGVEIYRNFAPGTFFKLPIEFQSVPAMAIFCFLKSFPGSELKTEFIEHSFTMIFKFEVEEFTRLKNCLGEAERCLIVNIIDPDQKDEEQQESNGSSGLLFSEIEASTTVGSTSEFQGYIEQVPNAPVKYCSRLTYLRSGKDYTPYMVDRIQIDSSLPSPGSKILICLTEVESPSSIYGTFSEPEDFRRTQESEFMQLSMWMNEVEVKKKFKKFRGELQPIIGEMVITEGKDEHCHRGLVTGVTGSIFTVCIVLFNDISNINLAFIFTDLLRRFRIRAAHIVENVVQISERIRNASFPGGQFYNRKCDIVQK